MEKISFENFTRDNWEEAMTMEVLPEQKKFAPTVAESLAAAYIKPWDEALDPYIIFVDDAMVGCFYISYTPESDDNYWIGGVIIDKKYQRRGYGRAALQEILRFLPTIHPHCQKALLTVEKDNLVAQQLYKSMGFGDTGRINKYDEIIYTLDIVKNT